MPRTTTHSVMDSIEPELLTVEETARYLSLSRSKTYQLIREGIIPTVQIGKRSRRVSKRDLLTWIDANTSTTLTSGRTGGRPS